MSEHIASRSTMKRRRAAPRCATSSSGPPTGWSPCSPSSPASRRRWRRGELVLMAGLAEMFAGAVSMGLGAFLGTRAERDWYERERQARGDGGGEDSAPRARGAARHLSQEGARGRDARARRRRLYRQREALGRHHDVRGAGAAAGRGVAVVGGAHRRQLVRAGGGGAAPALLVLRWSARALRLDDADRRGALRASASPRRG